MKTGQLHSSSTRWTCLVKLLCSRCGEHHARLVSFPQLDEDAARKDCELFTVAQVGDSPSRLKSQTLAFSAIGRVIGDIIELLFPATLLLEVPLWHPNFPTITCNLRRLSLRVKTPPDLAGGL
eukprot:365503-Amphidinium_carterae.1